MPSKALDTTNDSSVAKVSQPVLDLDADDIVLPRIYIGQPQSNAVSAKMAEVGDIYSACSQDGTDAEVLLADKDMENSDGITMHVLSMRKGKSYKDPETGEFNSYTFNDPDAPFEADTTYNYMVCLPEFDAQLPYKLLLKRSGAPTARLINTILSKHINRGPCWEVPLLLKSFKRNNPKGASGVYYIARVARKAIESPAEIKEHNANIELCVEMASILSPAPSVSDMDMPGI